MSGTNIILLHNYNGKTIGRLDFGENLAKAMEFVEIIIKNSYQIGDHLITVIDGFTGKELYNRTYRILKED